MPPGSIEEIMGPGRSLSREIIQVRQEDRYEEVFEGLG